MPNLALRTGGLANGEHGTAAPGGASEDNLSRPQLSCDELSVLSSVFAVDVPISFEAVRRVRKEDVRVAQSLPRMGAEIRQGVNESRTRKKIAPNCVETAVWLGLPRERLADKLS